MRSNISLHVVALALLTAIPAAAQSEETPSDTAAKSALGVSIAVPARTNGKRTVESYRDAHFHVVVTNTSDKPVRLWREWCSWGYYCLSFEYRDAGGMLRRITKAPRGWNKNFPDPIVIGPGEHFVYDVAYGDSEIWQGFPLEERHTEGVDITLRAVFEIKSDEQSEEHAVWTGRVASPEVTLTFYN